MKKMFELRKDELIVTGVLYALIALVMGIIMDVAASFDVEDNNTVPNFVGIMMLVSLAFVAVIMHMIYMKVHFNLAVGMGLTRKVFIRQYCVISGLFLLGNLVVVYIVALVEHLILDSITFRAAVYEEMISSILLSPWMIAYVLLTFAVELFLGATMMRWGAKGFWVIYGLLMAVIFGGRMLLHMKEQRVTRALGAFFGNIGVIGIVGMLVLLAVGLFAGTVKILKEQQVTT